MTRRTTGIVRLTTAAVLLATACAASAGPEDYCRIQVVDSLTGRGVPLVELRTVNSIRLLTDSNGIVAFNEPGLMDCTVFFFITSHGYEVPKDGFGYAGVRVRPVAGETVTIKIKRNNVAERLYRLTGQGIYRDSILTGRSVPLAQPAINAQVVGQDSVFACIYHDQLFWMWGDTSRASYPLGHFAMAGAVSKLPGKGGLDPDLGVDYEYFVDKEGFSRPVAPLKERGLVWLDGLLTLEDEQGRTRMLATFARLKDLGKMLERGLMVYNDETDCFEPLIRTGLDFLPFSNTAHAFGVKVGGREYFYFTTPTPIEVRMRVEADWRHITDSNSFEVFTSLGGSRKPRWISYGDLTAKMQGSRQKVIDALKKTSGKVKAIDVETGDEITSHNGTVNYNPYRGKWIAVFVQHFGGPSLLGEIWLAEADTPVGPWSYARRIITHNKYSFYNPAHHRFFDKEDGRIIYIEGTYSHTFSGSAETSTPRYDYNQIMYRLDLADRRMTAPGPIYKLGGKSGAEAYRLGSSLAKADEFAAVESIPFYAVDPARKSDGLIAIYNDAGRLTTTRPDDDAGALMLAPAADDKGVKSTMPLYEYRDAAAKRFVYSTDGDLDDSSLRRSEEPICRVWKTPATAILPDFSAGPTTPAD